MNREKGKSQSTAAIERRRREEERLDAEAVALHPSRTAKAQQGTLPEIELHQIELEAQNDELRLAQEELELSRNRYSELYDFAPVGYFTFDGSGVIREVNLPGAQLLGMERRQLANKPFIRFIADADGRETFSRHLASVLQRNGMQRCEIGLARIDGTVIHGQLQSVTVDTAKSRNGYILSSIVDGTVAKQLKTEIQDAREYAENIVETMREPLVVMNSDLKILTANLSFYTTFKVTPEETIDHFIYELGNRQWDIPALRVLFEDILPNNTVFNDYEVDHEFLDIGRKIILLNARQIFRQDIGSRIILLAMEDITVRKLLETEIQDAREYAENIVETVREPLVVMNSDLKILTANHSFYETFQVTPEETIGNFIYDLGNRQWDIPKLRVLFEDILPYDTVFNGYEVDHDFLDIGRKIILLNARQIFRKNIGSHIILLAMEDITERKQLAEDLQKAHDKLEVIVTKRTQELIKANEQQEQLERASSYKSEFLANMSHELRTPLNSMMILSHLLECNKEGNLSSKQVTYAATINGAGADLLNLINDILDLSKIEAGMLAYSFEETPVKRLCDQLEAIFRPVAEQKGLAFSIDIGKDAPPCIRTDEQRTLQILKNLLSNAFKFTAKGSVSLAVYLDRERALSVPSLAFAVGDTGIGIAPDKQYFIFQAFRQADGTTCRSFGGTGLGLSISRQLALGMRGDIRIESEEGRGSLFTLHLPATGVWAASPLVPPLSPGSPNGPSQTHPRDLAPSPERAPQPGDHQRPSGREKCLLQLVKRSRVPEKRRMIRTSIEVESTLAGKTVLIVDDDMRNVFSLSAVLGEKQMRIFQAENGQVALDMLQANPTVDIVLMDVMMPVMDGHAATRAIRLDPRFAMLPVLALTAKAMQGDGEACLEAGASDYLPKPIDLEQLLSLMRRLLINQP